MLSAVSEPVVGAATVRVLRDRGSAPRSASTTAIDRYKAGQHQGAGAHRVLVLARRRLGRAGQRRRADRRRAARRRRPDHRRQGARLRVPGHAVRRAGADRHPGAHRRPERHRRLAPGDRHPGHPGRRRRPRGRRARRCRDRPVDDRLRPASGSPTPAAPPVLHDIDLRDRAEHPGRGRRGDRLGQDHAGQAADPADGPDLGHGAARRGRPARGAVLLAARSGWCWCRRRASCSTRRCGPTRSTASSTPTDDEILARRRRSSA